MSENITLRKLEASDFDKGYLQLLGQLTTVGDISNAEFASRFAEINASPDYHIIVAEGRDTGKVIGAATLMVERKFVHACGKVGHIEDVVVDSSARRQHLGRALIQHLAELGRQQGCYKVILDCGDHNVGFYEKCGLSRKGVEMALYFE